jgi:hypothetical protein
VLSLQGDGGADPLETHARVSAVGGSSVCGVLVGSGSAKALSFEKRDQWFVDWKLAARRRDPTLCQSLLKQPYIDATPDNPPKNGCGWVNSVKFSEIGHAKMSVQPPICCARVRDASARLQGFLKRRPLLECLKVSREGS